MFEKLESLKERLAELDQLISDPEIHKKPQRYKELMQEHSRLTEITQVYDQYNRIASQLEETRNLVHEEQDDEMREMAREELEQLEQQEEEYRNKLKMLLVPRDPLDSKDTIVEIRAGTGGDEASLFAADLYRMYSRYAEYRKWKQEIMTQSPTEVGGFKEIAFSLSGDDVYGDMKYESGVHRVQRVPSTESGGRIHTSAVTVAVLPEAEETDIELRSEDIRMDVFRSSGPGGQSVNTTDSAVRLTHLPTGVVVSCQDEKSQHKNRAKAMRVLRARLYEAEEQRKRQERDSERKSQIGSGDRSERIRTYNFPQNRVTDHRINLTLYRLEQIMEGDIDEVLEQLKLSEREEQLQYEE
jgi:peptide chain release factor 1